MPLKKVIKILSVIVGLFLAGLAYLQYHQIANINWNKLQTVLSEDSITTLSNAITQITGISRSSSGDGHAADAKLKYKNNNLTVGGHNGGVNSSNIPWIGKLLQTPLVDHRKYVVDLILAPYLIVDRRLDEQTAYFVIMEWLDKCNRIKPLDFDPRERITQKIKQANRIQIPHISWSRLQKRNTKLYDIII